MLFCATLLLLSVNLQAADITYADRQNYIDTYKEIAIQEMHRSGIPASITLAQGILESTWGQGELALYSNNHFGIKCKKEWTGESYLKTDDDYEDGVLVKSCFRSYDSALESYKDHTDFLMYRSYYQKLFELSADDYVNWAYGLKDCGYATDVRYPEKLIKIIQDYGLHAFDEVQEVPSVEVEIEASEIEVPMIIILEPEEPEIELEIIEDFVPVEDKNDIKENIYSSENQTKKERISINWEMDEDYIAVEPNNYNDDDLEQSESNESENIFENSNYQSRIGTLHRSPTPKVSRR